MLWRIFHVLIFLLWSVPALAAPQYAAVKLFSPQTAIGAQKTVPVGIEITLAPAWKTYWRTPGESGLAPGFDWRQSENFTSADVQYPYPKRFTVFDIDNYGYEKRVIFPAGVTVTDPSKPLQLSLQLELLVCRDICLPETHHVSFTLPPGPATGSARAEDYQTALKNLPQQNSSGVIFDNAFLRVDHSNKHYLVTEAEGQPAPEGADLFIEHPADISFARPQIEAKNGRLMFLSEVRTADTFDHLQKALSSAPLTVTYVAGGTAYEQSVPLSTAVVADIPLPRQTDSVVTLSLARLLFFAFLGGLILNLMPCVLPVLSLKILSVVSHGGKDNRWTIFRNFSASGLGILTSFWLLAAGLVALKSAGHLVGWGIQFQHPAFLIFLLVIVLGFAANMWGVFEIPLPRFIARNIPAKHEHEPTFFGHFMTGAFATLLATPCTAPFLGTAIGFALAREAGWIFTVFTAIGLGLAFPYLLLAVLPRAFKYMPKPGRWMVSLKKALALALLATALWLGSILVTVSTAPTLDAGWKAFDEALILPAVDSGQVVIVDVTADWCLTCKANKRLVLDQADVVEALSGPEILKLQADWTHQNEDIGRYLQQYGRYGIPFNIVYGPAAPEGLLLPELLTKKTVLDAVKEAAGE